MGREVDVRQDLLGRPRATFVIDAEGIVRRAFEGLPETHDEEVLAVARRAERRGLRRVQDGVHVPPRRARRPQLPGAPRPRRAGAREKHLDVKFLWNLMTMVPAANAAAGQEDQADYDVAHWSGQVADTFRDDDGKLSDALRPVYLDYLEQHPDG